MACYVIGDIHGCPNELRCLIEQLALKRTDRLVFLGDYIDRGPDSKGVVSYLIGLQKAAVCETIFLKGNHEDMLLGYLGLPGEHGDMFLYNGGRATLASYGISATEASPNEILAQFPRSHIEFFTNLKLHCIVGPFLCVHAGVHPLKTLENQTPSEMLWIRNEFIHNPHRLSYTVIFGHTPRDRVLFDLPYKIGLDTGLVYGNKLSCFETEEKLLIQINRGKSTIARLSVKDKWNQAWSTPAP